MRRSQWSRDIKWRFVAARILSLLVRIPQRTWMSVCCGCCLLSGRGLCDELIISSEEYFRLRCVFVLSINSWIRRPWPTRGSVASKTNKQTNFLCNLSQKPSYEQIRYYALCCQCSKNYCSHILNLGYPQSNIKIFSALFHLKISVFGTWNIISIL